MSEKVNITVKVNDIEMVVPSEEDVLSVGTVMRKEVRELIYNTAKGRCALCGRKITYDKMTLDHIVPLAMNGADDVSNLQCTCEACNLFKGSVLPDDFMKRITEIFLYQMDQKEGKRLLWKIVHKILNKMV